MNLKLRFEGQRMSNASQMIGKRSRATCSIFYISSLSEAPYTDDINTDHLLVYPYNPLPPMDRLW